MSPTETLDLTFRKNRGFWVWLMQHPSDKQRESDFESWVSGIGLKDGWAIYKEEKGFDAISNYWAWAKYQEKLMEGAEKTEGRQALTRKDLDTINSLFSSMSVNGLLPDFFRSWKTPVCPGETASTG